MPIVMPSGQVAREYQEPFLNFMGQGGKRAIMVWHRRAGKDVVAWNWLIGEAMRQTGTYYYFFPTYSQGKKILWDGMDNDGKKFLHYIPCWEACEFNETEMQITFPNIVGGSQGSIVQLIGTDKINYIVGTNPIGCIYSEYSVQNKRAWDYTEPILLANKGWAVFVYTPRGLNHAYDLFTASQDDPEWYVSRLTVEDTKDENGDPIVPQSTLTHRRKMGEDEDLIQQEYYCSFHGARTGAYYSLHTRSAMEDGRVCDLIYDPNYTVDTFWDIGRDTTVVGFRQIIGPQKRWLDCIETKGRELPHIATLVNEKARKRNFRLGKFYFPHDMSVTEWGAAQTRLEAAEKLGLRPAEIVPKLSLEEGIDAVRRRFPQYYFDQRHATRIYDALVNYHKKQDAQGNYSDKPDHDWSSHFADMVRYEAVIGANTAYGSTEPPRWASASFDPLTYREDTMDRSRQAGRQRETDPFFA